MLLPFLVFILFTISIIVFAIDDINDKHKFAFVWWPIRFVKFVCIGLYESFMEEVLGVTNNV